MVNAKSEQQTAYSRLNAKAVIKFLCLFVFTYGLLMAAWPVVGTVYSNFYRTAGAFLFGSFGRGNVARFSRSDKMQYDICITAFNRYSSNENGDIQASRFYHNIRYGDYIHIAFLAALVVATPLPLRRRGQALIWALVLMHAFIALKIAIIIMSLLNIAVGKNCGLADRNIELTEYIANGFIIAFLIWVLVSFRGKNCFKAFLQHFSVQT